MSSPPPPNPAGAAADLLKSVAQHRPRKHSHPSIYQTFYTPQPLPFPPPTTANSRPQPPPPSAAPARVLYPVASSGRGVLPKHHRPSNSDSQQQPLPTVSANPKVAGQSPVVAGAAAAANHNVKSTRDKHGDDAFVVIRDRKVQVSEGTSLYAQCRSWLRNGVALENQAPPPYVDYVKSLPKPLPASMVEARKEDVMEIDEKTEEDVDHLSVKELLQLHVQHAKKVRARSRNERLQRIERYKDRLALLLPPVGDQQPKNDPAS